MACRHAAEAILRFLQRAERVVEDLLLVTVLLAGIGGYIAWEQLMGPGRRD
jgi:hypothetical protein